MSIVYRLNNALLPYESVRFNPEAGASFPSTAWYCETSIAGIIIEDQTGTLDISGWSTFTVEETSCSKPRIFTGWLVGKEISRGRDSNRVTTARTWNCDIVDQNALFLFETFRSTAASVRPEETDVARIQAMIASHAMAGTPIYDNGRLSTDDPLTLSPANFVKQYPADMAMSTAGQCGKNVYAYWDETDDQISIHYDAVGDGPAATISFSNVASDVNSTTVFAPSRDAVKSEDPYNLYTGVLLGWVGGNTYQRNQTLIDELSPTEFSPINFLRDKVEESSRIGRASTATTYTASQLARYGVERNTVTFSSILPASVVNLAHAGDIVTVRFSHLPGFTSATEVAIIRRSVAPVDGHDSLYEVTFECADFAGATAGGGGGGPHGTAACDSDLTVVNSGETTPSGTGGPVTITIPWTPTAGNTLVFFGAHRELTTTIDLPGFVDVAGYVDSPSDGHQTYRCWMRYYHVQSGDDAVFDATIGGTSVGIFIDAVELDGQVTPSAVEGTGWDSHIRGDMGCSSPLAVGAATVSPPSGSVALIGGYVGRNNHPSTDTIVFDAPVTELQELNSSMPMYLGYRLVNPVSGSYTMNATITFSGCLRGYLQILAAFQCVGSSDDDIPPLPFQPVNGETPGGTVNGVNTTFTTAFGAAEDTLRVLHDGIDQTNHITSYTVSTKTIVLDYAPSTGSTLIVYYEGAP